MIRIFISEKAYMAHAKTCILYNLMNGGEINGVIVLVMCRILVDNEDIMTIPCKYIIEVLSEVIRKCVNTEHLIYLI